MYNELYNAANEGMRAGNGKQWINLEWP